MISEDATRYVHRLIAVIVELDIIVERRVGVREEFIDDHIAQRTGPIRFDGARRTADRIADVPRFGEALAVGGPRQHERMARAVSGDRPWRFIGIGDLKVNCVRVVSQAHDTGTLERIGVRSDNVGDAVNTSNVRRRPGHDEEGAALENCVRRKGEINVTGETIAADVFEKRVGVKQLEIFEDLAVSARGGFIHDLGNRQTGLAAGRTERFPGQRQRAAAGRRGDVELAHLRGRRPADVVAGDGHAEVNRGGHRCGDRAELAPVLAIEAGVTGELVAHALEAQPGVRVIDRQAASSCGGPVRQSARFKETPAHTRTGQCCGKGAARVQRRARHQAGLGPGIGWIQTQHAHAHVEVAGQLLVTKEELVACPADIRAAAVEGIGSSGKRHRAGDARSAHVTRHIGHKAEGRLRVRRDGVAGGVFNSIDHEGVAHSRRERRGAEDNAV